jgi:hypothetical protein
VTADEKAIHAVAIARQSDAVHKSAWYFVASSPDASEDAVGYAATSHEVRLAAQRHLGQAVSECQRDPVDGIEDEPSVDREVVSARKPETTCGVESFHETSGDR